MHTWPLVKSPRTVPARRRSVQENYIFLTWMVDVRHRGCEEYTEKNTQLYTRAHNIGCTETLPKYYTLYKRRHENAQSCSGKVPRPKTAGGVYPKP